MAFHATCIRVITALPSLSILVWATPVSAAPFHFDRGQYQSADLDSVSAVSGASILRAFPKTPSTYHCPTSRAWIAELDPDRTKVAYSVLPTTGGDYDPSPTGRQTFAVGRARASGHGPTIVVFCFGHGGYPRPAAVTSGFVIPPEAPVSVCVMNYKKVGTPLRCR